MQIFHTPNRYTNIKYRDKRDCLIKYKDNIIPVQSTHLKKHFMPKITEDKRHIDSDTPAFLRRMGALVRKKIAN